MDPVPYTQDRDKTIVQKSDGRYIYNFEVLKEVKIWRIGK